MSVTDPQRAGLALGTPVRSQRAELKRRIKGGSVDAAALIAGELDDCLEQVALSMKVGDLLRAIPGVTGVRVISVASSAGLITIDTRLAELTIRQRLALAKVLRKEISA